MDDKVKVSNLYNSMNTINYNLGVIMENIDYLKETLSSNFVVDDKIVHGDEINTNRSDIRDLKISSKYDVIDDLMSNL